MANLETAPGTKPVATKIRLAQIQRGLTAGLRKLSIEAARLHDAAALEEERRASRKERLVKLFRTGFRGIEKSIANHPSFTEDDLDFFKEEGFNV